MNVSKQKQKNKLKLSLFFKAWHFNHALSKFSWALSQFTTFQNALM